MFCAFLDRTDDKFALFFEGFIFFYIRGICKFNPPRFNHGASFARSVADGGYPLGGTFFGRGPTINAEALERQQSRPGSGPNLKNSNS